MFTKTSTSMWSAEAPQSERKRDFRAFDDLVLKSTLVGPVKPGVPGGQVLDAASSRVTGESSGTAVLLVRAAHGLWKGRSVTVTMKFLHQIT